MRAVRTTVRRDDHAGVLSWPAEDGLPGGGIVAGSEPVTNIAVLLLAVVGPCWPQVDEARRVFEETVRAWETIAKRSGPRAVTERPQATAPLPSCWQIGGVAVWQDDFLTTQVVPPETVDLVVTSPPYNVGAGYGAYDDTISYAAYLDFTATWLEKALRLVKDDGRLCLNIPLDKNRGGQRSVYADVVAIAKKVGWQYHTTIVWNEQNISRRTAWGSWLSAAAPYVIAPVEMIAVLYRRQWKKARQGQSDIAREEFLAWTNGVWSFPGESKKKVGHPAPFPLELPRRCIKLFSYVGDLVLDPFLGSGTTLLACLELGRRGVGIEIDPDYCALAVRRLLDWSRQCPVERGGR